MIKVWKRMGAHTGWPPTWIGGWRFRVWAALAVGLLLFAMPSRLWLKNSLFIEAVQVVSQDRAGCSPSPTVLLGGRVIQCPPDSARLETLGKNLEQAGQTVRAGDWQLAYLSAKVYALQGRFADARASLDGAARFFPNDYDPAVDRGLIAWLGGDTVAARTEWAQVTASDWLYRLSQYWGERLPESLMATVLTALTTGANQSTRASAYESLGDLYRYRQEYIAALPFYVQAVELQPDKTLPHIKLAVTYNGLGRRPEAYEELARAAALPGISPVERADAYQWIGTLQIYDGRWDDAAGSYTTALAYDPGNANYLLRRGWLFVQIGRPEAALAEVQAALLHAQSLRNPVTAYVVRAQALMALRCYREAAGALDAAKRLDATDAEYQAAAAQFQRLVGVAGGEGKDCPALAHSP